MLTLFTCIFAQIIGAYIGPQFVIKFSASIIRRFIGIGLLIASFFILAGQFYLTSSSGTAIGLSGIKLVIAVVCLFTFGALNNIGIGSFAPTMMTIYALGLSSMVINQKDKGLIVSPLVYKSTSKILLSHCKRGRA